MGAHTRTYLAESETIFGFEVEAKFAEILTK